MRPPKRSLGQCFLVDRGVVARIVEAVRVGPGDTVLEIGPGRGALTGGLARVVRAGGERLVLVELDDHLARWLERRFGGEPEIEVIHGDILDVEPGALAAPHSLKVVGNIPYNLTSPILFHLLSPPRPAEILLMVQREVAARILAAPGTRAYGALTVGVRSVAEAERVLGVSSGAFRPRPKVDSSVIRIRPLDPSPLLPVEERRLRELTRALFQWRRKQLGKIMRDHPELRFTASWASELLRAAGARATDRPEAVSPEGFRAMARRLDD